MVMEYVRKGVQKINALPVFAKIGPKVIPTVDRWFYEKTGVLPSSYGTPTLMLSMIGRKSGEVRTTPLAYFKVDGRILVIGSNFGREKHPVWSHNLLDNPWVKVSIRRDTWEGTARRLTQDEVDEAWPKIVDKWPVFAEYKQRIDGHGRDIRVFELVRD